MFINPINTKVEVVSTSRRDAVPAKTADPVATAVETTAISPYGKALSESAGDKDVQARAIMSRYDLRNIRYTDLVSMAGELRDAGALKQEDYLDFIGPSPEFGSLTGEPVANWNTAKDYVADREQQVAFMRANGAEKRFIEFASYHLALYQHFQSLHSS